MDRQAAVSIDLDEIGCYHRIHGLPPPAGSLAKTVWERSIDRHVALLDSLRIPATFFVVGADLEDEANVRRLRAMADAGHEIANHSLSHQYDLVRRNAGAIRREVLGGADAIERAIGKRPVGFRAPGYAVSERLFEVLAETGARYDSSLFPSAPYYVAKAAVLLGMRLVGRRSASVLGDPRAVLASALPHRAEASGLVEIPIGVVPGPAVPFIGTTLALAGPRGSRFLARAMTLRGFVHLELHGVDLCDADADGLWSLSRHQVDLRFSIARKLEAIRTAVETLRDRGYRFVRLCDVRVD